MKTFWKSYLTKLNYILSNLLTFACRTCYFQCLSFCFTLVKASDLGVHLPCQITYLSSFLGRLTNTRHAQEINLEMPRPLPYYNLGLHGTFFFLFL